MSEDTFRKGFLRVALTSSRDAGERRSGRYHSSASPGCKRYRPAFRAKLARLLQVLSTGGTPGRKYQKGINATIDWDAIEKVERSTILSPTSKSVFVESNTMSERPPALRSTLQAASRLDAGGARNLRCRMPVVQSTAGTDRGLIREHPSRAALVRRADRSRDERGRSRASPWNSRASLHLGRASGQRFGRPLTG